MRAVESAQELSRLCDEARAGGARVGLVPTMGALHRGHARLIEVARERSDFVVVTVFVNPTQFGPSEDLAKYPRTLDADSALSRELGASVLFTPEVATMYPAGEETRVRVGRTAGALCGEFRPTHFEGVTTVVAKLFGAVGRSVAVFGRKDYQQLRVISRMAADLFYPVEIVGVPTVREPDGLALSSRNRYLSPADRVRALGLARGLSAAVRAFEQGERRASALVQVCRDAVEPNADSVDYVTLADAHNVEPFDLEQRIGERALLAVAARVGGARLIDNVVLGEDPAPIAVPAGLSAEAP